MGNLKEENKAESALTVGSLTVLQGIEGPAVKTIKRDIEALQTGMQSVAEKTAEYWRDISNDKVITPTEKVALRREYNTLNQTYNAIMEAAEEKGYKKREQIVALEEAYTNLREYLFGKLKLFNDMTANTDIDDINAFNLYFSTYYDKEYAAQSFLNQSSAGYQAFEFAIGTLDTYPTDEESWYDAPPALTEGNYLWIRTAFVDSEGTQAPWSYTRISGDKGEIGPQGERGPEVKAQYSKDGETEWHDIFDPYSDRYMKLSYDDGVTYTKAMKVVGEDGQGSYSGSAASASEVPTPKDGTFFLVVGDNVRIDSIIKVNGLKLTVNGKYLKVKKPLEKGYIYFCYNKTWVKVTDKDNYRYVLAVNDLIKYEIPISPELQAELEKIAGDKVDEKVEDLEKEIHSIHTPVYLGEFEEDPETAQKGDWFTYTGEGSVYPERKTSYIYLYDENTAGELYWKELSQTDVNNYSYYMAAFPSVMNSKKKDLSVDYFATVFAEALIGNTAFLKKLCTQLIELNADEEGNAGIIKSHNYTHIDQYITVEYSSDHTEWSYNYIEDAKYYRVYFNGILKEEINAQSYTASWYVAIIAEGSVSELEKIGIGYDFNLAGNVGKYMTLERRTLGVDPVILFNNLLISEAIPGGFQIDTVGNADFSNDMHIGGNTIIDGDTTIEGNALFKGFIESGPLMINETKRGIINVNLPSTYTASSAWERLNEAGIGPGMHKCSGSINGENVTSINLSSKTRGIQRFLAVYESYHSYTGYNLDYWNTSIEYNDKRLNGQYIEGYTINLNMSASKVREAGYTIVDVETVPNFPGYYGDRISCDLSFGGGGSIIRLMDIPTEATGLPPGSVYQVSGILKIVN